jgi:hypothetical protein
VSGWHVLVAPRCGLTAYQAHIYETLSPANEQINHATLSFIRRANVALDKWWAESDELHRSSAFALSLQGAVS